MSIQEVGPLLMQFGVIIIGFQILMALEQWCYNNWAMSIAKPICKSNGYDTVGSMSIEMFAIKNVTCLNTSAYTKVFNVTSTVGSAESMNI